MNRPKPPLEVFCHNCQKHFIQNAVSEAKKHLTMLRHKVTYFDAEHLNEAEAMGVPARKLRR